MHLFINRSILVSVFLFASLAVRAQLNADFSIQNAEGCSPLKSTFQNLSTGTSASTVYSWDFGNNNRSSLRDPSAVYLTEGTYTVTLTVRDGAQTSTRTRQVRVFNKPTPSFSFSTAKGCLPLTVRFNSTSIPGDGVIASYYWDFGDGTTRQTSSPSIDHVYQTEGKATVSLTVTNQYGCHNTVVQQEIIEVLPTLVSDFTVDQTVLCTIADQVKFTNKSSGPGTLSYRWDFGDGTSSTAKDPTHVFAQKGIYTIQLTVTSSEGCVVTKTQSNYVNVASYKADFSLSNSEICLGTPVNITPQSTPTPTQSTWQMGDGNTSSYPYYFSHYYYNKGDYQIKLVNSFGACKDSITKMVKVKPVPIVNGFLDTLLDKCGAPARMKFVDTTAGAVSWEWSFMYDYYTPVIQSTLKEPVYTYQTSNTTYNVRLKVTNAEGCSAATTKYVTVTRPYVQIESISSTANGNSSCTPFTMKFKATSSESISSYKWNFPGGATSTDATPEFTFTTFGIHSVSLNYTTVNGCTGNVFYNNISLIEKPVAKFVSASGTDICGNTLVRFSNQSTGQLFQARWFVDGVSTYGEYYNGSSDLYYRFTTPGKHTIRLIATGICHDTMTLVDYITVKPPFIKLNGFTNTCEGDRGTVRFFDASTEATNWLWEFGDGATATYTSAQPSIDHRYTSPGTYKARLSITNGSCTLRDSVTVTVMLKQKPQLTISNANLCATDNLNFSLTGIEEYPNRGHSYSISRIEYGDGSYFNGNTNYSYISYIPFTSYLSGGIDPSKDKLRMILFNNYTGCYDTTNYVSFAIRAAKPAFVVQGNNQCYQQSLVFKDQSTVTGNNSIVSWEWNLGDGRVVTNTTGADVSHTYANPGNYYVTLRIKDASGCTTSSGFYNSMVSVKGPKAAFYASGTNVPLSTTVYFYNNTNNYNVYNIEYTWDFGNGQTSNSHSPSYTYTTAGTYIVTLTARDPLTGCTSQEKQTIIVREFNSAFNFSTSFIGSASCPPVVARFNNTSAGAVRVTWDFGDGVTAGNVNYPSHVYTKPGTYIVTLYVYGYNGLTGTYTDSVKVKNTTASISFDPKETCSSQPVKFTAVTANVSNYLWDFGDGQLFSSTDSQAIHLFRTPGVYKPSLLITNNDGCTASASTPETVTIDSLSAKISGIPAQACNQVKINFKADVYSVGAAQHPNFLTYKWNFGTGNPADTSATANPVFEYITPGTYTVTLLVTSRSGCVKEVKEQVLVKQSSKAAISGPVELCAGETARFTSTATISNGAQWNWDFKNGQTSALQNPPVQTYATAGAYPVSLVVNNQGCLDTTEHLLNVRALPIVQISPSKPQICLGSSVQLNASGGDTYQWSPITGLSSATNASPIASPQVSTVYQVLVTNQYGCKQTDSVSIKVVQPFKLTSTTNYVICEGESIQFVVTGAASYRWIANTTGLSAVTSGTVTAKPATTTSYKVVGYDAENCFTDTLDIEVVVNKRPVVNAGNDVQSLPGNPVQLNATGSADIVSYQWRPPDFLSCVQCASPISTATKTTSYIVEVKNTERCSASDTVTIRILCNSDQLFIPNSFTPNADGKNDYFTVLGNGASLIKLFVIYDRWGNRVFERKDLAVDDPRARWDGNYNGYPAPIGGFTYYMQLVCDATGESFVRSGTVQLIR